MIERDEELQRGNIYNSLHELITFYYRKETKKYIIEIREIVLRKSATWFF